MMCPFRVPIALIVLFGLAALASAIDQNRKRDPQEQCRWILSHEEQLREQGSQLPSFSLPWALESVLAEQFENEGVQEIAKAHWNKAFVDLVPALACYLEIGDDLMVATTYARLARCDYQLSRYRFSLVLYDRSMTAFAALNDNYHVCAVLINQGAALQKLSEFDAMNEKLTRAEAMLKDLPADRQTALQQGISDSREIAEASKSNLATALQGFLDELQQFDPDFAKTQQGAQNKGDILNNVGLTYQALGQYDKALEYYNQAVKCFEDAGVEDLAATYVNIGDTERLARAFPAARAAYEEGLKHAASEETTYTEADGLYGLGLLDLAEGKQKDATKNLQSSLKKRLDVEDLQGEGLTLCAIAESSLAIGKQSDAIKRANRGLQIFIEIGDLDGQAKALDLLRKAYAHSDPSLAIALGKEAVITVQRIRQGLQPLTIDERTRYAETKTDIFRGLADLLIDNGRIVEAEHIMDLLKGEEHYEFVERSSNEDPELLSLLTPEEEKLVTAYDGLAKNLLSVAKEFDELYSKASRTPEEDERYKQLNQELEDAEQGFVLFVKDENQHLQNSPVDPDEFESAEESFFDPLSNLQNDTGKSIALIRFVVSDRAVTSILLTPDSHKPIARSVRYGRNSVDSLKAFNDLVAEFRKQLSDPKLQFDPRPDGKRLYDILFSPLEGNLKVAKPDVLMISADGSLRSIPFAALSPDGDHYLGQSVSIETFIESSRFRINAAPVTGSATYFGATRGYKDFPDLPGVQGEINDLAALLPGQTWLDEKYTKDSLDDAMKQLQNHALFHIAGHFQLGTTWDNSYLLMGGGDDRLVPLSYFYKQQGNRCHGTDLLVLSACETSAELYTDPNQESGFIERVSPATESLADILLQKGNGAAGVMASLWKVADEPTRQLMVHFVQHRKNGETKADALRHAQLDLMELKEVPLGTVLRSGDATGRAKSKGSGKPFVAGANRYAHPYFWAPFVLYGNWR